MENIPQIRLSLLSNGSVSVQGDYILYWMTSARRVNWNFGLQQAVNWGVELAKPLLVVETLAGGRRWDSDRMHAAVLEGMLCNGRHLQRTGVKYYPFVERDPGETSGLIAALAARACVAVTDEFPIRENCAQSANAAKGVSVHFEQVDSNGLLPLRATDHAFPTAYAFRRFLQKNLIRHLFEAPKSDPLANLQLPPFTAPLREITRRWPVASADILNAKPSALQSLPINHQIDRVALCGGSEVASREWRRFLGDRLDHYSRDRNQPDIEGTSGISPWLHFGHFSSHQVFTEITEREKWTLSNVALKATGGRNGWWGLGESVEDFLDQLITWRELGFNMCFHRPKDYDLYDSLPSWAKKTLDDHAGDPRPYIYTLEDFQKARTHDPLWNAAQRQLLREGRIHNYLRMLWGKKILEWTQSPREGLEVMRELNNLYALDGCDPNSYSGIFWVLGRYDHAWGPERLVYGKVRYMSSANTARKVRVLEYQRRYGEEAFSS